MTKLQYLESKARHAQNMETHWREEKQLYQAEYRKIWNKEELEK